MNTPSPASFRLGDRLLGPGQPLFLMAEIGIVLRRGPEHVEKMPRVDLRHLALVDPALNIVIVAV